LEFPAIALLRLLGIFFIFSHFARVDEKPTFEGGDIEQFAKWMADDLVYPKSCKKAGIQGNLIVSFTISPIRP
jgi:hypothetical protein